MEPTIVYCGYIRIMENEYYYLGSRVEVMGIP